MVESECCRQGQETVTGHGGHLDQEDTGKW